MPDFKDRMADYVPVNERIEQFYRAHPEGSIQSEIVELTASRVTVKAYAYRTPDDPRPGIGHSSLDIPGSTPYTKGSEIENCETSAWGRSIAALGFEVKRGVASREEVANKQSPRAAPTQPDGQLRDAVLVAAFDRHLDHDALGRIADAVGVPKGTRASADQLRAILARIEQPSSVPAPADGGAGSVSLAPPTTPLVEGKPDSSGSAAATAQDSGDEAVPPGTSPSPALAPDGSVVGYNADAFMDRVMAVTGGTEVPPKPGTDAYRLLPDGVARSKAKAWHEAHPEPDEPTLAEQLQVPA